MSDSGQPKTVDIIASASNEDEGTEATDVSSCEECPRKNSKVPTVLPALHPHDFHEDQLKTVSSEVVEAEGKRTSLTQFLCCVNDEEMSKYGYTASNPIPTACKACVVMYAEKTRQRFERNIESLLSTVDSRNDGRAMSPANERSGENLLPENFESRYREMVDTSLTVLQEEIGREEAESESEAYLTELDTPSYQRNVLGFSRSKASRMRWLKRKMLPNTEQPNEMSGSLVRRVQSFDDHVLRNHRLSSSRTKGGETKQKYSSLSHALEHACQCGGGDKMYVEDSPIGLGDRSLFESFESDDDEMGYDSDPEFAQVGQYNSGFLAPIKSCDDEECVENEGGDNLGDLSAFKGSRGNNDHIDFNDLDRSSHLIEEVLYGTMTLIWHPPVTPGNQKNPPTCVKAWIELGCRVKGQIIQPKLVWRNAYQEKDSNSLSKKNAMVSGTDLLHNVDILDIARIFTSQDIDRERFPLAKKSTSFTIVTTENELFLFEVSDANERDRIVSSLKLLVARLASLIIVGDKSLFEDFFYPSTTSDFQKKFCGEETIVYAGS